YNKTLAPIVVPSCRSVRLQFSQKPIQSRRSGRKANRAQTENLPPMFSKSSTSCRRWFIWLSCMIPLTPILANDALVSQNIDQLVEQGYREHKIEPNPPSSDEVFLRRIYLDVVGRIPTHDEATSFYAAEGPNKRSQ